MRHFCGAKKLGPDYTFIHCLRVYLLLVSPVGRMRSEEVAPPVFPHSANSYFNSQEQVFTSFHRLSRSIVLQGYHSMYARAFRDFCRSLS